MTRELDVLLRYVAAVDEQERMKAVQDARAILAASDSTVDVGDAIEKQKPKKPIYVDTRFRNHGKHISDGVSLSKCYKCPNCNSHIFHVFDSEKYCDRCGQALDWRTDDG